MFGGHGRGCLKGYGLVSGIRRSEGCVTREGGVVIPSIDNCDL